MTDRTPNLRRRLACWALGALALALDLTAQAERPGVLVRFSHVVAADYPSTD